MTRHSPSEAALGEMPVSGLHANFTLLSAFNDAVGKEVLLELVDGSVFTGIFGGASSEMEVGLYCAYEKTGENEKNLLPLKKDIVQKRQFAFSDIVCVTVPTNDEKIIKGFATDRDYHNKRRAFDDEDELEEWEGDGEDVDLESEEAVKARTNAARNGGWGVNEMFAANQSLGVKTTFEDNLSQYTTAEVEGTDDDRRRADEIARQIEKSGSSRMYSALENDDEERDLDKITEEADLLGADAKNKNCWSNGSNGSAATPTAPSTLSTTTNQNGSNGVNGSTSLTCITQLNGISPRPQPLMTTAPPGFTPVTNGHRRKSQTPHEQSHNTYLTLASRGMNNNGRGGSQITPKNNRAEGLKGDTRRPSNSGPGGASAGGGGQGGGGYVKRDSYDGQGGQGGQGHNNYDSSNNWNNKGGMKTYENTKMRDQKMMLENRNTPPNNSPRNSTGGPPSGPSTPHNQKGGASGRVEGLKAWQNDFNPSYRETRPMQKGQGEKMDSSPQPTPLLESAPPTKNAWQSGPPSGLTSSSKSEETKSGAPIPSPSNTAPTPAEIKMADEREMKEDAGPSTSNEGEKTGDTSANETKEDPDMSKDSKKSTSFSFNPDAPAFTPKFGSGGGGGGMGTPIPQPTMMQNIPIAPTLVPTQGMSMQGQMSGMAGMGGMAGMQQVPVYPYPGQPQYPMASNMQYSAVVNGGGIMPGGAQNGQGQVGGGGAPSTPRGVNGGQGGGGMGSGIRQQRQGGNGGGGGAVPVPIPTGVYMQPGYPVMAQQNYMQPQANPYYPYPTQPTPMLQGNYAMQMNMQQQGMMGQPQRVYPQATHPSMMMPYNVQQQYGGGPPPGVNPQQGGGGNVSQGGATPSVSTTNGGPPSNGNGGGQGGAPNTHPPSQPPTPGAVPSSQTGGGGQGGPPQGGMMTPQGGPPGMVAAPVHSPGMYGGMYAQPMPVYYNQGGGQMSGIEMGGGGGQMGGGQMHGGDGGGGGGQDTQQMHQMYQYTQGQYYQTAPPHIRAAYSNMNQSMQQQQQQHVPAQPSQSQN